MKNLMPKETTQHYKRQCDYKRFDVLCSLLKEGDRILDVGCGIGTYTSNPLSYLPISITAIDSDPRTIEYAKARNGHKNLEFMVAYGEYFDADLQYDLIVCSHILEHVQIPVVLLGNMRRLLKDDGILYLGIPNGFGWFEMQNFVPRMMCKTNLGRSLVYKLVGKAKDTLNVESQHVHFFTIGRIRRLLRQVGWQVVEQINDEFLGGIVFDRVLPKFPSMARWNVDVADKMPAQFTNGWIFVCKKEAR